MPHLHLDVSRPVAEVVDLGRVLGVLVDVLSRTETVNPAAVKAYATVRDVWAVGAGHPGQFVHCMASLLEGRPVELRRQLSAKLLETLRSEFALVADVGFTVEIREMDPATYAK